MMLVAVKGPHNPIDAREVVQTICDKIHDNYKSNETQIHFEVTLPTYKIAPDE